MDTVLFGNELFGLAGTEREEMDIEGRVWNITYHFVAIDERLHYIGFSCNGVGVIDCIPNPSGDHYATLL